MNKAEKITYIFVVKHLNDMPINKTQKEILGHIFIKWTNYLCEPAEIWTSEIVFDKLGSELEINIVDPP